MLPEEIELRIPANWKDKKNFIGNDWLSMGDLTVETYNESIVLKLTSEYKSLIDKYKNGELEGDDIFFMMDVQNARILAKYLLLITDN